MSEIDETRQVDELWAGLRPEARKLLTIVLNIERENLQYTKPEGVVDEIVKSVEALVK
ncbi:hypothetical protein GCM10010430_29010 [Kitasatospora cystarginea]|uniref:Uncharacterized protein n=1 Tax=Kitasatospora cystarginea TaxID=58350 RepID=A0ABN3DZQ5_9ACTN